MNKFINELNEANNKIENFSNEIKKLKEDNNNLNDQLINLKEENKQIMVKYKETIIDEDKKNLVFPNPDCIPCKYYNEKPKIELKCGHFMCKECIEGFIMQKFMKEESYKYTTICLRCKKESKLSIFYL